MRALDRSRYPHDLKTGERHRRLGVMSAVAAPIQSLVLGVGLSAANAAAVSKSDPAATEAIAPPRNWRREWPIVLQVIDERGLLLIMDSSARGAGVGQTFC
jgi:hypothetical protein